MGKNGPEKVQNLDPFQVVVHFLNRHEGKMHGNVMKQ